LSADQAALRAATSPLNAVIRTDFTFVFTADQLAMANAQLQLLTDRRAIFGPTALPSRQNFDVFSQLRCR